MATCGRGHTINGPIDKLPSGQCKACHRDDQAKYRQKRKASDSLLAAVLARGMTVGEAINVIQRVDYWGIQKAQGGAEQPTD